MYVPDSICRQAFFPMAKIIHGGLNYTCEQYHPREGFCTTQKMETETDTEIYTGKFTMD